jgi:uncharacterized protein
LSDLHIDQNKNDHFFINVITRLNQLKPDIVFITGDFTDCHRDLEQLKFLVKLIQTRLGIYAVLGNHDFWGNPEFLTRELQSVGVILPQSNGITLNPGQNHSIHIFGVNYPYLKPWKPLSPKHLPNHLNIALSHSPDNIFKLAKQEVDLVFSGHLHGGQWRFPIIGSIVSPSRYDRLFDYGCYKVEGTYLFVTAGIGNVFIRSRINCPSEILVVDLQGSFDLSRQTDCFVPDLIELPAG